MQDNCKAVINKALRCTILYSMASAGDFEYNTLKYDLQHLSDDQLNLLSVEIYQSLRASQIISDESPDQEPSSLANFDEEEKFFQIAKQIILTVGVGRFELLNKTNLNLPYPLYELLAKRVFEALEASNCLAWKMRLDGVAIFKAYLTAGEESS